MSHHPERTARNVRPVNQPPSFFFSGYLTLWFLPVLALGEVVLLWAIRLNIVFALLPLAGGLVILFPATIADLGSFSICLRVVARTIPAIFFLSVGYLIWPLYKESENCRKSLRVMIAIALIVFGFVASRFSPGVNWCGCLFGKSSLAFLLSGVFSSLGILTAFKLISYEIRLPWLEWVGRNSLLIMVFHFVIPFIFVARLIVEHVIGVKCVSALIACALVMVFQYPSIMAYNSVVNILRRKCFRHE